MGTYSGLYKQIEAYLDLRSRRRRIEVIRHRGHGTHERENGDGEGEQSVSSVPKRMHFVCCLQLSRVRSVNQSKKNWRGSVYISCKGEEEWCDGGLLHSLCDSSQPIPFLLSMIRSLSFHFHLILKIFLHYLYLIRFPRF